MLAIQSLLADETERDPHAYLRAHDPVHFDEEAGAYLLTRHEDVRAAYRDPVFSTGFVAEERGLKMRSPRALPVTL